MVITVVRLCPSTMPVKKKKLGQYSSGIAMSWFTPSGQISSLNFSTPGRKLSSNEVKDGFANAPAAENADDLAASTTLGIR